MNCLKPQITLKKRTIRMSRSTPAFQCELAETDEISVVDVLVRLGTGLLGDNATTLRKMNLQTAGTSHVIRMHVRIDCTKFGHTYFSQCGTDKLVIHIY